MLSPSHRGSAARIAGAITIVALKTVLAVAGFVWGCVIFPPLALAQSGPARGANPNAPAGQMDDAVRAIIRRTKDDHAALQKAGITDQTEAGYYNRVLQFETALSTQKASVSDKTQFLKRDFDYRSGWEKLVSDFIAYLKSSHDSWIQAFGPDPAREEHIRGVIAFEQRLRRGQVSLVDKIVFFNNEMATDKRNTEKTEAMLRQRTFEQIEVLKREIEELARDLGDRDMRQTLDTVKEFESSYRQGNVDNRRLREFSAWLYERYQDYSRRGRPFGGGSGEAAKAQPEQNK